MDSLTYERSVSRRYEEYRSPFNGSENDELCNNNTFIKEIERTGTDPSPLDVSEVLRRWTLALKNIHKQALRLAQTNNEVGPKILAVGTNLEGNAHAHVVRSTLDEHKEHLENVEVLMGHVKSSMPGMKAAIASLSEEADAIESAANSAQSSSAAMPSTASLSRGSDRCLVSSRSIAAQIEQDNVGVTLANAVKVNSGQDVDSYGLFRSLSLEQDKYLRST